MIRLFLLYAILIFAKRAPKMITDLLNIKSEGMGLKGLNIKNKMGEAALVGDKVKKGMTGIEGRTKGTVGGALGGFMRAKGGLKDRLKAAAAGASRGYSKGKHDALQNGDTKGVFSGAYKEMGNIASGGRTSFFNIPKNWLNQADDKIIKVFGKAGDNYSNPQRAENQEKLDKIKIDLTKRYGAYKADQMLDHALKKAKKKFGDDFNIANEEHWMYLTKGQVYANGEYVASNDFSGLKDAVDYSGTIDDYTFDSSVAATMNTAYRYSNISTNIDKKRAAFDESYQKYMDAVSSGVGDADMYRDTMNNAFKKYIESLDTAKKADLLKVNVDVNGGTINGKTLEQFVANQDEVDSKLSKQISELKANTDSMMQKEEIKQKESTEQNGK